MLGKLPTHTVVGATCRAIPADVEQGEKIPFLQRGQIDIFCQQINRLIYVPGNRHTLGRGGAEPEGHHHERGFVIHRQILQIEPRVDPDELRPPFFFDRVDLHEQNPRVFDEIIPRLEMDRDPARLRVSGNDRAPLIQVERGTVFGHWHAQATADVQRVNLRALV